MKKIIALPFLFLCVFSAIAQSPQAIPYQAVLRNTDGSVIANQTVTITFTIHNNAVDGTTEYQENHSTTSNALGLINLNVGQGTPSVGTFSAINWGSGTKFLQVAMNNGNGNIDLGTQQMLSVPYALHSKTSDNGFSSVSATGDTLYMANGNFIIVPGISAANNTNGGGGTTTGTTLHSCGAANVHNPNLTYGSMTDQEGNTYKTIIIGSQEWMAENLNTSIYSNGDNIPQIANNLGWSLTTNGASGFWAENNSNSCPYGRLYNWYAVADSRGLCPTGWHVPSDADWTTLINFIGGNGGALKSAGIVGTPIELSTGLWAAPNTGATNSSGFSGLPGGAGNWYTGYYCQGCYHLYGYWWSNTGPLNNSSASAYGLYYDYSEISNAGIYKKSGCSVRCLRD